MRRIHKGRLDLMSWRLRSRVFGLSVNEEVRARGKLEALGAARGGWILTPDHGWCAKGKASIHLP
jgi:hypothetical protein